MNNYNDKKEEKGGFWSALSGLFRGGSSAMGGGASSGMGAAGGLFATKAGIVGMVLGGATIAAGIGVVYNFVGSSSKPVYSPELFQQSYYEDESASASQARAQSKDRSSASASTLDIFSAQAKKDGLSGLASEAGGDGKAEPAADAAASAEAPADGAGANASAGAPAAPSAGADGGAKLKPGSGFSSSVGKGGGGGSSSSVMPRMQNAGGLSGGIGGQFATMYKAPAGQSDGRTSAMSASMAARTKGSPKYAVPNFNKKGAHAQAKFANAKGSQAVYSADAGSARSTAGEAFSGETSGAGDVATPDSGAGLGGAGISQGSALKGSDPSLNSNKSTIPPVTDPTNASPWKTFEDKAMKGMIGAVVGIILIKLFAKLAKMANPITAWIGYVGACISLAIALASALIVVLNGIKLMQGDPSNSAGKGAWAGQSWMGGIYVAAGLMLAMKAWDAFCEVGAGADAKPGGCPKPLGAGAQIGDIFKGM